jgi:hypothetical protein
MNAETKVRKQRAITSDRVDPTKPAAIIINDRFGGLTRFCELTGYKTSTAHGWTLTGFIPPRLHGESTHSHILAVAEANGIEIEAADFVERPVADLEPGDALAAQG